MPNKWQAGVSGGLQGGGGWAGRWGPGRRAWLAGGHAFGPSRSGQAVLSAAAWRSFPAPIPACGPAFSLMWSGRRGETRGTRPREKKGRPPSQAFRSSPMPPRSCVKSRGPVRRNENHLPRYRDTLRHAYESGEAGVDAHAASTVPCPTRLRDRQEELAACFHIAKGSQRSNRW